MMVLLDTGVRASELTALRIRDYESKRGQLIIHHGKGDKNASSSWGSPPSRPYGSIWPAGRVRSKMILCLLPAQASRWIAVRCD